MFYKVVENMKSIYYITGENPAPKAKTMFLIFISKVYSVPNVTHMVAVVDYF